MILIYPIIIKPYILKYVASYNKILPYFTLTDKSKIAFVLISSLQRKGKFIDCPPDKPDASFANLQIAVPWKYQNKFGSFISYENQLRFNEHMRKDFKEKMCDYVLHHKTPTHGNILKSLLNFRDKYGITEDELQFKTMQKWWEREGQKFSA